MITFSRIGNFGRLGNQLFQIAAVLGLAEKYNDQAVFPLWEYSKSFKNPIDTNLNDKQIKSVYREPKFSYSPIPYSDGMDLSGYFQSDKYFNHCSELIRYHFQFIDEIVENKSLDQFCSIHIRRGDYLNISEYHPIQSMEYYNMSINIMESMGYERFLVFSDDILWCKNNFSDHEKFYFSDGNSNIQDLALMSKCGSNIIANSSFSWWGAWLNNNHNKKVIAPSLWFGPAKKECETADIYCDGWTII